MTQRKIDDFEIHIKDRYGSSSHRYIRAASYPYEEVRVRSAAAKRFASNAPASLVGEFLVRGPGGISTYKIVSKPAEVVAVPA